MNSKEMCEINDINKKMENLSNLRSVLLPHGSRYVKPFRLYYSQNGKEKSRDLLKVPDSVAIIIFNTTRNCLVFVRQFRPAVYVGILMSDGIENIAEADLEKYPATLGITLELCCGAVDKDKLLIEIAQEEIIEEVGYNIPTSRIEQIMQYRSGVDTTGALQTLFYCEVTDSDKKTSGGGIDNEIIEVVEYTIPEAQELVSKGSCVTSPPSFSFGVSWFLSNRAPSNLK